MKAIVGVTDNRWAAYLRDRPTIYEANFWVPSAAPFRALPGQPFLFKTHAPANQLVGGGFFDAYLELRVSEAWAVFGEGNGVGSEDDLRREILRYRASKHLHDEHDPTIGCISLRNLFFAAPGQELPQPPDWKPNIVTRKSYDLESPEGEYVKHALSVLSDQARVDYAWDPDLRGIKLEIDGPTYGAARLMRPRVGQAAFKTMVASAYSWQCAVTGSRIMPVLEAAHIRPVAAGVHRLSNGLLLRSDVHKLYDDGYLGVDADYRLRVSPRLRTDFGNGVDFYRREASGQRIAVPDLGEGLPDPESLTWHMDEVFKAS